MCVRERYCFPAFTVEVEGKGPYDEMRRETKETYEKGITWEETKPESPTWVSKTQHRYTCVQILESSSYPACIGT